MSSDDFKNTLLTFKPPQDPSATNAVRAEKIKAPKKSITSADWSSTQATAVKDQV